MVWHRCVCPGEKGSGFCRPRDCERDSIRLAGPSGMRAVLRGPSRFKKNCEKEMEKNQKVSINKAAGRAILLMLLVTTPDVWWVDAVECLARRSPTRTSVAFGEDPSLLGGGRGTHPILGRRRGGMGPLS